MSANGVAAVVSGVDLALVSWMDGPVVDLSSVAAQPRPHQHQRIGRCLCAKDAAVVAAETEAPSHHRESSSLPSTLLKPTLKKHRPTPSTSSSVVSYSASTKGGSSIDRHIVPQVVQVVSQRTKQQQQQQHGQVSRTNSASAIDKSVAIETGRAVRINRANTQIAFFVVDSKESPAAPRSGMSSGFFHCVHPDEAHLVAEEICSFHPADRCVRPEIYLTRRRMVP